MCTQKVYVRDKFRLRSDGSWFPCGKCKACRQASADRRARRIRYHHPKGFTCYFVTLTYHNKYIPFVLKKDIINSYSSAKHSHNACQIPVYRSQDVRWYKGKKKLVSGSVLCNQSLRYYSLKDFSKLDTVVTKRNIYTNEIIHRHPYKVSVAYAPDSKNFLKRLRENLFRCYGYRVPISYYYAPEYGADAQRFHLHFLLWFPSSISEVQVRSHCIKAWPYACKSRESKFCELARNPSSYLASYVNSSDNVSSFLLREFKVRPSHSLGFGYDEDVFQLSHILQAYENGRSYKYNTIRVDKDGKSTPVSVYYPKYIINKYFPRIKGYSRLSTHTLRKVYAEGQFRVTLRNSFLKVDSRGRPFYFSNLFDVYGNSIQFTECELSYFYKCLHRAKSLLVDYMSPCRVVDFILRYLTGYYSSLYYDSCFEYDTELSHLSFFNLSDVKHGFVRHVFSDIVSSLPDDSLSPNSLPHEITQTVKLIDRYNDNIKHRKVNATS